MSEGSTKTSQASIARERSARGYSPCYDVQDYEHFPDDGIRYEIIGGDRFMTPAPTLSHQIISSSLFKILDAWVEDSKAGFLFYAPVDVELGDNDIVQPDLAFVSRERRDLLTPRRIVGAPDLVIEILSKSTAARDRREKRKAYQYFGIGEYWIVDPEAEAETVTVYQRAQKSVEAGEADNIAVADGFTIEATLARGDELRSVVLPGLMIRIEDVFTRAAELPGAP